LLAIIHFVYSSILKQFRVLNAPGGAISAPKSEIYFGLINYKQVSITRFEKVNEDRLMEVLQCSNLPKKKSKENGKFKYTTEHNLRKYYQLPLVNGKRKIIYDSKNNIGRNYANNGIGLQFLKKDIRKYIAGDHYTDIDIKNCHPVLLKQLFHKYQLTVPLFLSEYVKDRNKVMKQCNWKDKQTFFKLMYQEKAQLSSNTEESFKLHQCIYNELIPKLKKDFKKCWNSSNKNTENKNGSFISKVLFTIENDCLMACLNKYDKFIDVLCFDGFLMKQKKFKNSLLKEFNDTVRDATGFNVEFEQKSMTTTWKPIIKDDFENSIWNKIIVSNERKNGFSRRYIEDYEFYTNKEIDEAKLLEFVMYLNQYVCLFNNPMVYGFRDDVKNNFTLCSYDKVKKRVGKNLHYWEISDDKLVYERSVFHINPDVKLQECYYNTYRRPAMAKSNDFDFESSPLNHYLLNIICNKDVNVYNWLIKYISHMVRYGKTNILLVLMGKMGTGKSLFVEAFLSNLISDNKNFYADDYVNVIDGIDSLMNNFNSFMEHSIVVCCEEIVSEAGEYHKVQEKLKSLTTSTQRNIEKKGIDSYKVPSVNNFILITNNENPIKITEDNRRAVVLEVSDVKKQDQPYFTALIEYIDSNIEYIRDYFFNNIERPVKLQQIRPKTIKEMDLLELNKCNSIKFAEDQLQSHINTLTTTQIYQEYVNYCTQIGEKKLSQKYFAIKLNSIGIVNVRVTCSKQKKKVRYFFRIGEITNCKCSECKPKNHIIIV
jgi:hypothetical protein